MQSHDHNTSQQHATSAPEFDAAKAEVRLIEGRDASLIADYFARNRAHFAPWEPLRAADYHSAAQWQARISESLANHSQCSYLVLADPAHIWGMATLSNQVRGPFQACYLGYGIDQSLQGKGLATRLCEAALTYAFDELKLHRVMANYMPANHRSAALLKRLGFETEGLARAYLQINGQWEDHVLTAKIAPGSAR
ncbi:GNAT family N-acetyltransferase [Shewanella litorisediminis]|uniref:GNAT family N-acetyltransferase n=2 Tax=Shewanella litorisediminis TaxID=1173586 RepID=A0ABX7G8K9_9GAMM|nr:GNAT family N-acetyltransferase [Shewanella litorisediminis]